MSTARVAAPAAALLTLMLAMALLGASPARAQSGSGPTVAPDLESVGNFRPGPVDNNGDFRTFVDFTFDQQVFLTGSNRTAFGLVPTDGGDSIFGSDFIPSEQTDPEGDNTITVLFNGDLSPADFARGFVSNDTVSSGPQGNEPLNVEQAEPVGGANTSVNPDLRSVRIDCQQNQVFFTFDEPLDQEDVVQNTGGLQVYFEDLTRASAQSVDQTADPATIRAVFSDLPQGKTLSDVAGAIVTNGTVAGQPPNGPGGQAINQLDELAPVEFESNCFDAPDRCEITGTPGDDTLTGTPGDDVICGLGGDDELRGLGGNDELIGGEGADTLIGGSGRNELRGGAGNDTLRGGDFKDRIIGSSGDDTIRASNGPDEIFGGAGADDIRGGIGEDEIRSGPGDDRVVGGSSADTIFAGGDNDEIFGNRGGDRLFAGPGEDRLNGGVGNDTLLARDNAPDDTLLGGPNFDTCRADSGDATPSCER